MNYCARAWVACVTTFTGCFSTSLHTYFCAAAAPPLWWRSVASPAESQLTETRKNKIIIHWFYYPFFFTFPSRASQVWARQGHDDSRGGVVHTVSAHDSLAGGHAHLGFSNPPALHSQVVGNSTDSQALSERQTKLLRPILALLSCH